MDTLKLYEGRGITKDTSEHYKTHLLTDGDVVFTYGKGTKTRTLDKCFSWQGTNTSGLFGQDVFKEGKFKTVVVTEGEFDAMAAFQILGGTVACVSVENGASGALGSFKKHYKWLDSFEKIVIAFDNDTPGKNAAKECAAMFSHKAYVLEHTLFKDANDYLENHRSALWLEEYKLAKKYMPDSIVTIKDILDDVLKEPVEGIPWAFKELTTLTHGRRQGELYGFGAGVGMGKTDVFTQMITHDLVELNQPVGVFYLEQPQKETALRIAGKMDKKVYHTGAAKEEWEPTVRKLAELPLYLFKHSGAKEWEVIKSHIIYLVKALDVKLIYLDHLTALVSDSKDERRTLDSAMADMASVAQENGCIIHFISHLSTPTDGKSHEEGARIRERDFTGSRAIMRWAHYLFGIEGDKNSDNEDERNIRKFRVLKDRYTGQATGKAFQLQYCAATGMLSESVWEKPTDEEIL